MLRKRQSEDSAVSEVGSPRGEDNKGAGNLDGNTACPQGGTGERQVQSGEGQAGAEAEGQGEVAMVKDVEAVHDNVAYGQSCDSSVIKDEAKDKVAAGHDEV